MDSKVLAQWVSKGAAPAWDLSPVIREDEWPVIAHGSYRALDDGGAYEPQAHRWWRADVHVRQHDDGRAIVYGAYDYSTAFSGERDFVARAGLLLDQDADLVAAIRTVGEELARVTREAGRDYSAHIAAAVHDCIADLPAQELE